MPALETGQAFFVARGSDRATHHLPVLRIHGRLPTNNKAHDKKGKANGEDTAISAQRMVRRGLEL